MTRPDSYKNIKGYAEAFHHALFNNQIGITATEPSNEVFAVLMERDDVKNLIDALENIPEYAFLAAIMGIAKDDNGVASITISLLGTDSDGEILADHVNGALPGQEVWPNKRALNKRLTFLR